MTDDDARSTNDDHPLDRAHRFFQRAAPAIREAGDVIVQRVDEAIANATAIEGDVVEARDEPPAPMMDSAQTSRPRRSMHWAHVAIVVAAASYCSLRMLRSAESA